MNTREAKALRKLLGIKNSEKINHDQLNVRALARTYYLLLPQNTNRDKSEEYNKLKAAHDAYLKIHNENELKIPAPVKDIPSKEKKETLRSSLHHSPFSISHETRDKKPESTVETIEIKDDSWNNPTLSIVAIKNKKTIAVTFNKKNDKKDQQTAVLNPFFNHPIYPLQDSAFEHEKTYDVFHISKSADMLQFLQLLRYEKPDLFRKKESKKNQLVILENELKNKTSCQHVKLYKTLKESVIPKLKDLGNKIVNKAFLNLSIFNIEDKKINALKTIRSTIDELKPRGLNYFQQLAETHKETLSTDCIQEISGLDKKFVSYLKMKMLDIDDPLTVNPLNPRACKK